MRRTRLLVAAAAFTVVLVPALAASAAPPTADQCTQVRDDAARRSVLLDAAVAAGGLTHGQLQQVDDERAILAAALRTCAPVPSPTPSATGAPSPTANPTPTPSPPGPSPTPGPGSFPGPDNTGVPPGTVLTAYTGPCTITVANTIIDAKTVTCDLVIRAAGVRITRSRVNGVVAAGGTGTHVDVVDSDVDGTPGAVRQVTVVGDANFLVLRSEVVGGNRGVLCARACEVRDSWIHGQEITSNWHASAVRMEQGSVIVHNTLHCEPQPTPTDGGCSADLTGYPDFAPVRDNLIQANLFVANPTGNAFCAYGGATGGKPFSSDPTNATNIRFLDNVFQRGANRNCAAFGPVTDFATGRTGNVWSGNVWDSGEPVTP